MVVVRYFGGTKLGVSGLVNAYKTAAQEALNLCDIITETIDDMMLIKFPYEELNNVYRVFNNFSSVKIQSQSMEMECVFRVSIRQSEVREFTRAFEEMKKISINILE